MILQRQIDRTLYTYDTQTGALHILSDNQQCELTHEMVHGLTWFVRMAGVGHYAARIERKHIEASQDEHQ